MINPNTIRGKSNCNIHSIFKTIQKTSKNFTNKFNIYNSEYIGKDNENPFIVLTFGNFGNSRKNTKRETPNPFKFNVEIQILSA